MQTTRLTALLIAATVGLAACGADLLVTTERSDQTGTASTAPPFVPNTDPDPGSSSTVPATDPTTDPTTTAPGDTDPVVSTPLVMDYRTGSATAIALGAVVVQALLGLG